jgi:molybdopterin/thiamine biosynthesis adenylyltransferase/rhodanese-related sulfurtransferase
MPPPPLRPDQARRYARQLSLPAVGEAGQRRLLASTVALVGAGGLGCPAALYLAAAGVGRLVVVDGDRVDASNLHRQILYGTRDEGRPKAEVAAERLRALNPDCEVIPVAEHLRAANAREILAGADVVLDGSDNFATRYLVNDACVLLGKPNAHGSILRFEGQMSWFDARTGPCYRCLHPEPPPPGLVPSCAEAGVLGALPGVVGTVQATETLKYLLGAGDLLSGRLLLYDALALSFREVRLRKDPDCPACGAGRADLALVDLPGHPCEAKDGGRAPAATPAAARPPDPLPPVVSPEEVRAWCDGGATLALVDVREPWEFDIGALPGAVNLPLGDLEERRREIPADRPVVVYCHRGVRSFEAMRWLRSVGLPRVASMDGGTDAWSVRVDPDLPRY